MNTNATTYSDYMMIISPPAEVMLVIDKYKRATARVIGSYEKQHSKAHISITKQQRQMTAMMMQKLDCYQKPLNRLQPVMMHVNGFNFFKQGDTGMTIYAKIELNLELTNWFTHLKRILGDKTKNVVPHITIAKNITLAQFREVWPKFVEQQYQHSFMPQCVTVLSRPMIGGRHQPWEVFREMYFNNFGY